MREQLLNAYRRHGYEIRAGQAVTHWIGTGEFVQETVLRDCASAWRDGRRLDCGYGLSWSELSVLEFLAEIWTPRTIFGIGNGFGWSAVAMRLLWPRANLAMLDDGSEGTDGATGCQLTSIMLGQIGGGTVWIGTSPQDVPACVTHVRVAVAPIELVLIDATHTDEAQWADYQAVRPFLAPEHVVLFHDVLLLKMGASFTRIAADYHPTGVDPGTSWRGNRGAAILHRTTTGMGIVWTADAGRRAAQVFGGYP